MKTIIDRLNEHKSHTPSRWREDAAFRIENRHWLRYSQAIAMMTLDAMEQKGLTQKALAEKMGCTQQYVSKILKGRENMSLETISKLEQALELDVLGSSLSIVDGYLSGRDAKPVYLSESSPEYGNGVEPCENIAID